VRGLASSDAPSSSAADAEQRRLRVKTGDGEADFIIGHSMSDLFFFVRRAHAGRQIDKSIPVVNVIRFVVQHNDLLLDTYLNRPKFYIHRDDL